MITFSDDNPLDVNVSGTIMDGDTLYTTWVVGSKPLVLYR